MDLIVEAWKLIREAQENDPTQHELGTDWHGRAGEWLQSKDVGNALAASDAYVLGTDRD